MHGYKVIQQLCNTDQMPIDYQACYYCKDANHAINAFNYWCEHLHKDFNKYDLSDAILEVRLEFNPAEDLNEYDWSIIQERHFLVKEGKIEDEIPNQ